MFKKIIKTTLTTLLTIQLLSCGYTDIRVPLDKDVNNTILGDKVGSATSKSIAWLVAWGDSGTNAAARDGNIATITHLDAHYFSIFFGLYSTRTTIAYGN